MIELTKIKKYQKIEIYQKYDEGFCYVDFANPINKNDTESIVFSSFEEAFSFLEKHTHGDRLSVDLEELGKSSDIGLERSVIQE